MTLRLNMSPRGVSATCYFFLILSSVLLAAPNADCGPGALGSILQLEGTLRGSCGKLVYFSPDGGKLLTTGGDAARVWDPRTLRPLTPTIQHTAQIDSAGWTKAADRVFTAGGHQVRFWDAHAARLIIRLSQEAPVKPTCISPDGLLAVTGNGASGGVIWDANSGKTLRSLPGPSALRSAVFSAGGEELVTINWKVADRIAPGSVVRVVRPRSGEQLISPITSDASPECLPAASLSPDGTRLIVAFRWAFRVFDIPDGKETFGFEYHNGLGLDSGFSTEVHFTPDGSAVIWALDEWMRLFDAATHKPLGPETRRLTTGQEEDLACSRDGRVIYFAGPAAEAGVWDMTTGRRIQSFGEVESTCVALSPDGSLVAVSHQNLGHPQDGFTDVWKLEKVP